MGFLKYLADVQTERVSPAGLKRSVIWWFVGVVIFVLCVLGLRMLQ